jgi:Flp pilus assembly protein TadD
MNGSDQAAVTMSEMVTANPLCAEAHLMHARYLLEDRTLENDANRLAAATKECATALTLAPESADGWALASYCAQQARRYDEARGQLRKSLELNPQVAKRYLQLANIELLAQATDSARGVDSAISSIREGIAAISEAPISEKSAQFDLRWRLCDLLIGKQPRTEADTREIQSLRAEFLRESPDSPLLAYLDARQLFVDEQWVAAQNALETSRSQLDSWPDLQAKTDEMLGICYTHSDRPLQQVTVYRRLLESTPFDISVRQRHAESLAAAGRPAEALNEYALISLLLTEQGAPIPVDIVKQQVTLQVNEMSRRPRHEQDWASLATTLHAMATELPADPWFPLMRANIAYADGKSEEAAQILEAAAKSTPQDLALQIALVDLAQNRGQAEQAARRMAEIEMAFGDTLATRLARARLLIQQQGRSGLPDLAKFVQAVDQLPAAEQTPQLLAEFYWQLAQLCWSQADILLGCTYGREAATRLPQDVPIRLSLLKQARVIGDVVAARQWVDEIQLIDPDGAAVHFGRALHDVTRYMADKAAGQVDATVLSEAQEQLRQAATLRPNWPEVSQLLGDIALELQNEVEALDHYQRALKLGYKSPDLSARVATLLFRQGRFDDADKLVQNLVSDSGETTFELSRLASRISYSRNDLDRALSMARISVEQAAAPQQDDLLFLGRLYAMHGEITEARTTLEKAIQLAPSDPFPHLALVQLLVAAGRQAEANGRQDDAKKFFLDAETAAADAEQRVEPDKKSSTAACCHDLFGKPELAAKYFDEAIKASPRDAEVLQAAVRCYLKYPPFHRHARHALEQLVSGTITQDEQTLAWARRELASLLVKSRHYQDFLAATKLIDINLQAAPDSAADLELRARLLSARLIPSLTREAVKSLERLMALPQPTAPATKFFLAQLYDSLGRRVDANRLRTSIILEPKQSDLDGRLPFYLQEHVRASIAQGSISEARIFIEELKRVQPKALSTALLEGRTLVPARNADSKGPAPECLVKEALQVLAAAVDDSEVHAVFQAVAGESPNELARRDAVIKKSRVAELLVELYQDAVASGDANDAELLRAAADRYYSEIAASDPRLILKQVPFLLSQRRRPDAIALTTDKAHQQSAEFDDLTNACGAVLADLEKQMAATTESDATIPVSQGGKSPSKMEEWWAQDSAIEEVLQEVLDSRRMQLKTASGEPSQEAKNAVASVLSRLANHYYSTGQIAPQRFQQAAHLYREILELQPVNVEAIQRLAMLRASSGQDLSASLSQIDNALASTGPLPVVLDTRAMILLACQRPQEALEAGQLLLAEKPDHIDPSADAQLAKTWGRYHFHLAMLHAANANRSEASKALSEAVSLGVGEADIHVLERPHWQKLQQAE